MDREEEKQARTVISDVLYSPDKKHLSQVARTDMIVDYMNVVVGKYKIIERAEDIETLKRRNLKDLGNAVGGVCSGRSWCCCCCTNCFSAVFEILKLTLLFMIVFFVFCGVVTVLWYGWQFFSQGWRSFLPGAWGAAAAAAGGHGAHTPVKHG